MVSFMMETIVVPASVAVVVAVAVFAVVPPAVDAVVAVPAPVIVVVAVAGFHSRSHPVPQKKPFRNCGSNHAVSYTGDSRPCGS